MANENIINKQLEENINKPQELSGVLVNLNNKINKLNELNKNLFQKLIDKFKEYQEKIEKWDLAFRQGKLDKDQQAIFLQLKYDFYDFYHDLIRFQRFTKEIKQTKLKNNPKPLIVKIYRESENIPKQTKNEITFSLNNNPVLDYYEKQNGVHTYRNSPILAKNIEIFEEYINFVSINSAYKKLGNSLYRNSVSTNLVSEMETIPGGYLMIPIENKNKANEIAKKLYIKYCQENRINYSKAIYHDNYKHADSSAYIFTDEEKNKTWHIKANIRTKDLVFDHNGKEYYISPYIAGIHELMHVERSKVLMKKPKQPDTRYTETATVINQIIYQDQVYKEIHNIPLDKIVKYPKKLPSDKLGGISVGELANVFRKLKKEYGTIEKALMSEKGKKFVFKYYNNNTETWIKFCDI